LLPPSKSLKARSFIIDGEIAALDAAPKQKAATGKSVTAHCEMLLLVRL
jgi:hypothetical protein